MAVPDQVVLLVGSAGTVTLAVDLVRRLESPGDACLIVAYHRLHVQEFHLGQFLPPRSRFHATMAAEGTPLQPGHIYYPFHDHDLVIADSHLQVRAPQRRHHPNLDLLLSSAAHWLDGRTTAAVASGMLGIDGPEGLAALRRAGGRVLGWAPHEAMHAALPAAAVAAGAVDEVLMRDALVDRLAGILQQ